MKKLTPKKSGFTKKSLFVREDFTYEIGESESLPENTVFGFELPEEEGNYFARTQLGAMYIKILGDGIEILPWSTSTGLLGNNSYIAGAVIPERDTHDLFVLTDGESNGAYQDGVYVFVGRFDDGNFNYTRSFVEIGDSLIVPHNPMSINRDTGDINWVYLDQAGSPSYPWGLHSSRFVVNDEFFIFLHEDTNLVVLDTSSGTVIEEVPQSVFLNVDYPEEGNLLQLNGKNEFLYMGDDYTSNVGRGYIITVDPTADPGSRVTIVEHPESGALNSGKRVFWGWYENSYYQYWGIWNNGFYLDTEEGSYYLLYFSNWSQETGSLIKFSSSHSIEWIYDLYDLPTFNAPDYIFYNFCKAGGRIAFLPCYGNMPSVGESAGLTVLDDSTGLEISLPTSLNEKVGEYTIERQFINIVYPKAPEGSKIPFIGHTEFLEQEAVVYGHFDIDTLEWVDYRDFAFPGSSAFFAYPLDGGTGILQREADGKYFYFVNLYEPDDFGGNQFSGQFLVRLGANFDTISYEKIDFGFDYTSAVTSYSLQSAVSSQGRIYGMTYANQIFSSSLSARPRKNEGSTVTLVKDEWYDFKSEHWNTGLRPFSDYSLNTAAILSTSQLPSSANFIPLTRRTNTLNLETGRLFFLRTGFSAASLSSLATTLAPDQETVVCVSTASSGGSQFFNAITGEMGNVAGYPYYGISATIRPYRYLFRQDGTPVIVRASFTQTIIMQHDGSSWLTGPTLNLTSASAQRYFIHNDSLYAFRAVDGGDAVFYVYNWDTPSWTIHSSVSTPVGSNYYDSPISFSGVNTAERNGILYFSNGFEYNIDSGQFTEVPYSTNFNALYGPSGAIGASRITLQAWGDYLIAYYHAIGSSYLAFRPLEESLSPPF